MAKRGQNEIVKLVAVLEKGDKDKREITIDDIISNPISCGYLLDFCQKSVRAAIPWSCECCTSGTRSNASTPTSCDDQYCAENLNFFMAVDKFKDECSLLDFRDPESVTTCKEMADQIWADYLSLNSPNEVSLPSEDRAETMERMKKPGEFRAKLFDVAIQDAIKTLQKDTLMRFLKSPQYNEMAAKVTAVHQLLAKRALEADGVYQIDMPTRTMLTEDKVQREFSLDDILNDKIHFTEMLEYLEKSECSFCYPPCIDHDPG